jgi:NTE family protein
VPAAQSPYGPEPRKQIAVVLVLGPGMAKGFAHAGVIRALRAAKIPIGAILGTEMGGLIGAIYAVDGNLNHFEWSLLRLKPEIFSANGGAILSKVFRERGSTEKLEGALRKILDRREIQQSKIPLRVSVVNSRSRKVEVLDRGDLVSAAHGAVAAPGFFKPAKLDGEEIVSADALRPFLIREAKGLNIGPVIAVDAGGGLRSPELEEADLVIRPDLGAMKSDDFSKRSEAAFRGKQALNARLPEIKKLLGVSK